MFSSLGDECNECFNLRAELDLAYMSMDTMKARIALLERENASLKGDLRSKESQLAGAQRLVDQASDWEDRNFSEKFG